MMFVFWGSMDANEPSVKEVSSVMDEGRENITTVLWDKSERLLPLTWAAPNHQSWDDLSRPFPDEDTIQRKTLELSRNSAGS